VNAVESGSLAALLYTCCFPAGLALCLCVKVVRNISDHDFDVCKVAEMALLSHLPSGQI
jgi:hypothetical protein